MNKTERAGLILTKQEKSWILSLAEFEGGLTQAALIRRLIRKAAMEHGFSPSNLRRDNFSAQVSPGEGFYQRKKIS